MVVHVDVETNGFSRSESSLLSVYAEKDTGETYERFYYPVEEYNQDTIDVNGLTEDKVDVLRGDATYARHFKDDHEDLVAFLDGCTKFVAFNVSFDFKWMPEAFKDLDPLLVCTMRMCKEDVGVLNDKGKVKYPKLRTAALHFNDELPCIAALGCSGDEAALATKLDTLLHDASMDARVSRDIYLYYKTQA